MRFPFVLAATVSTMLAAGAALAAEVPFSTKQTVQGGLSGAGVAVAADLDRDGDLDVLGCTEGTATGVGWWQNAAGDGSAWIQELFDADFDCRQVVAADLDGDGDLDAVGAAWDGSGITWWENGLGGTGTWTEHGIDTKFSGSFGVAVGDLDQDGDLDVVAGRADGMTWWASDGTPADGGWTAHAVAGASGVDGVVIADLDADGDLDLATAGGSGNTSVVWWESDGGSPPSFAGQIVTTAFGDTHQIAAGDVNGDGRLDLVVTSSSDGEIAWFDRTGPGAGPGAGDWTESPITDGVPGSEWARIADVDADGDLDVLGTSRIDGEVSWFENADGTGASWTEHVLLAGWANARSIEPADLDGDGDVDVLAAAISAGQIGWWENLTLHRSSVFPPRHTVAEGFGSATVHAADLDGDGDLDLVGAPANPEDLVWWENDGTPCTPACSWPEHLVDDEAGMVWSLDSADVDGDGDLDLLAATFLSDEFVWWENDGSWTRHLVSDGAGPMSIQAVDLDQDGDLDVLGAAMVDGVVVWWENDGTPCAPACSWPIRFVDTSLDGARFARAADLDGDGDLDVVAAASGADAIVWWENDGPCTPFCGWPEHTIATGFDGAWLADPVDLDGDGDLDVLGAASEADAVVWWENDGTPCTPGCAWPAHTIDDAFVFGVEGLAGDRPVRAVDLDGDGDLDVAGGALVADLVVWWENDGTPCAPGCSWPEHTLAGDFTDPNSLAAADLDRDGLVDLAVAGDGIAWWSNRGGQLALPTADAVVTPAPLEGTEDVPLLAIDGAHRGRAGDGDAELATLELLFEQAPLDPLTGAELDALADAIRLYLDDGDGVFEPGTDDAGFFTEAPPFSLTDGVLTSTMVDGDPSVQLAVGAGASWWLAVDLAADAGSADPSTFRVTHRTTTSSTGEMSSTDLPLALEYQDDVASSILTVRTVLIFEDGFESGDATAWTTSTP